MNNKKKTQPKRMNQFVQANISYVEGYHPEVDIALFGVSRTLFDRIQGRDVTSNGSSDGKHFWAKRVSEDPEITLFTYEAPIDGDK